MLFQRKIDGAMKKLHEGSDAAEEAVSYTHLDVYKRQNLACEKSYFSHYFHSV